MFWFYVYKEKVVKVKIGNDEESIVDMWEGIVGFYVGFGGDR